MQWHCEEKGADLQEGVLIAGTTYLFLEFWNIQAFFVFLVIDKKLWENGGLVE